MVADRCRENKRVACVKRRGGKTGGMFLARAVYSLAYVINIREEQEGKTRGENRRAGITVQVEDNNNNNNDKRKKEKPDSRNLPLSTLLLVKPALFVSLEEEWKEEVEIFTRI